MDHRRLRREGAIRTGAVGSGDPPYLSYASPATTFSTRELGYLGEDIFVGDDLVGRISDLHIISRILTTNNAISLVEVDGYLVAIFVDFSWTKGDHLIQRRTLLVGAVGEDDTTGSDAVCFDGLEQYAIREGSDLLDHIMREAHTDKNRVKI